jgi:hypothetical protein
VAQAHEPYVAPLAYHTENTQVPVLSAYAEQAFHPEYALKDISFSVFQPNQTQTTIQAQKHLESATAFDLKLPEKAPIPFLPRPHIQLNMYNIIVNGKSLLMSQQTKSLP